MSLSRSLRLLTLTIGLSQVLPASAALFGRDLDPTTAGYEAYYDDVLDVTWQTNTNLVTTNLFGLPDNQPLANYSGNYTHSDYVATYNDGRMTWGGAKYWLDAMNGANYLGYSDWRLPKVVPRDGTEFKMPSLTAGYYIGGYDAGYDLPASTSELGHLFLETLGNVPYHTPDGTYPQPSISVGFENNSYGPFLVTPNTTFWMETDEEKYDISPYSWINALYYDFTYGFQAAYYKSSTNFTTWALRDGDVAVVTPPTNTVPVPHTLLLFGLGLVALFVTRRRDT